VPPETTRDILQVKDIFSLPDVFAEEYVNRLNDFKTLLSYRLK